MFVIKTVFACKTLFVYWNTVIEGDRS